MRRIPFKEISFLHAPASSPLLVKALALGAGRSREKGSPHNGEVAAGDIGVARTPQGDEKSSATVLQQQQQQHQPF